MLTFQENIRFAQYSPGLGKQGGWCRRYEHPRSCKKCKTVTTSCCIPGVYKLCIALARVPVEKKTSKMLRFLILVALVVYSVTAMETVIRADGGQGGQGGQPGSIIVQGGRGKNGQTLISRGGKGHRGADGQSSMVLVLPSGEFPEEERHEDTKHHPQKSRHGRN